MQRFERFREAGALALLESFLGRLLVGHRCLEELNRELLFVFSALGDPWLFRIRRSFGRSIPFRRAEGFWSIVVRVFLRLCSRAMISLYFLVVIHLQRVACHHARSSRVLSSRFGDVLAVERLRVPFFSKLVGASFSKSKFFALDRASNPFALSLWPRAGGADRSLDELLKFLQRCPATSAGRVRFCSTFL